MQLAAARPASQRSPLAGTPLLGVSLARPLTASTSTAHPHPHRRSAFPNARALAKHGAAPALVAALRRHASQPRDATAACCAALRQVAANDDICQEAAGAGAVGVCLGLLGAAVEAGDAGAARPALSLLRQLASSDAVKGEAVSAGALGAVRSALGFAAAAGAPPAVAEQALGLLCNLTLRSPDAARAAAACGCADAVLRCMESLLGRGGGAGGAGGAAGRAPAALRQACMAVRNMGVRCPELRPELLERGAEAAVRRARAAWPEACGDVGSAALRDLGLDNYND
jgi:hypothetical protein